MNPVFHLQINAPNRLGFAADSYPRFIIPTETYDVDSKTTKKLFDYETRTQLYEQMVEFIQKLFFKYEPINAPEPPSVPPSSYVAFPFIIFQICAGQSERTKGGDR